MKRTIALATASFMTLGLAAAPALAQSADTEMEAPGAAETLPGVEAPGAADSPDMGLDSGATGSADVTSAVSAIGSSDPAAIQGVTEASTVNVVWLDTMTDADASADLQAAISENSDALLDLQAAIEANPALTAKLQEQQVEAASVVAAETEVDGSLTVYVQ